MPEWTPEVTVTPEVARRVLAEQVPELAGLPVRPFDAGWDNLVLAVGDAWLVRFVHRAVALDGSRREVAVLRAVAGRLPLPVPTVHALGTPTPQVPWPFFVTPRLPGVELARAGLADDERGEVAEALGGFLRALHAPALADDVARTVSPPLPVDPIRRADAPRVAARARERLTRLALAGVDAGGPAVTDLLAAAERLPAATAAPVLVHGDLHVRHVLVDGALAAGVIDWGDTALADPCVDLMIAYAAFTGRPRERLLDAYGHVPEERELRARVLAVAVSAALAEHALADGPPDLLAEAAAAIGRAAR